MMRSKLSRNADSFGRLSNMFLIAVLVRRCWVTASFCVQKEHKQGLDTGLQASFSPFGIKNSHF